jgi:transposase-like protein
VLIPVLYLKGISTGDFEEALAALVGKEAPGLSASTISRLKEVWTEEHARWQKRDCQQSAMSIAGADGIHLEARLEEQAQCILVIIGATPKGRKELVGFTDGLRESSQSWPDRRSQPVAKTDPGCEVHRWDRGLRHFCRASSRRLIPSARHQIRR